MIYNEESLADICSARQLARIDEANRAVERIVHAENERKRKVGDATIELNEQTKRQNEILAAQLAEAQKANELLVKQAADSARDAKCSHVLAIIALVVSLVSAVLGILF